MARRPQHTPDNQQGRTTALVYHPPHHYGVRPHRFMVQCAHSIEREAVVGYEVLAAIGILGIDRRRHRWIVTHLPTGVALIYFPSLLKAVKWCAQVYKPVHYAYWHTTDLDRLNHWLLVHSSQL